MRVMRSTSVPCLVSNFWQGGRACFAGSWLLRLFAVFDRGLFKQIIIRESILRQRWAEAVMAICSVSSPAKERHLF